MKAVLERLASQISPDELKRLRRIEKVAHKLWSEHCASHDNLPAPQKFGMNYGTLLKLGIALGVAKPTK